MQEGKDFSVSDASLGITGQVDLAKDEGYTIGIFGHTVGKPAEVFGVRLLDAYAWDRRFLAAVNPDKTLVLVIEAINSGLSKHDQGRYLSFGHALVADRGIEKTLQGRRFMRLHAFILSNQASEMGWGKVEAKVAKETVSFFLGHLGKG